LDAGRRRLGPDGGRGGLSEQDAHQPVGERHERYAARFGLDPAPGRAFIATLGFRGPTLEQGPALRLERRYDQAAERVWRALTDPGEPDGDGCVLVITHTFTDRGIVPEPGRALFAEHLAKRREAT
jgi:hypothetical protein